MVCFVLDGGEILGYVELLTILRKTLDSDKPVVLTTSCVNDLVVLQNGGVIKLGFGQKMAEIPTVSMTASSQYVGARLVPSHEGCHEGAYRGRRM